MHVDDMEKAHAAMLKYAEDTFHECRTPLDLYARIALAFKHVQVALTHQAAQGLVSPELAEAWSWYSMLVPSILKVTMLEHATAQWGTRGLEVQCLEAFTKSMRDSRTMSVNATGAGKNSAIPAVLQPIDTPDPEPTSH